MTIQLWSILGTVRSVAGHSWKGCVMMHVASKSAVGFAFLATRLF